MSNQRIAHAPIIHFPVVDDCLQVGGIALTRLAQRVGTTPFYAYDRRHTALYYEAARKGAGAFSTEYLSVFVHGAPDHADYLARIGGEKTRARLSSWRDGPEAWKRLYMDEAMA